MEKHVYFPENAFRKEPIVRRLVREFMGRSYRAEDVKSIRTSVHYKNFRSEGPEHKYNASIGFAFRLPDGNFTLSITHATASHTPVNGTFNGFWSDTLEYMGACSAHEVITKMKDIEQKLAQESELSRSYPHNPPFLCRDSLHLDAAAMVFAEPASYYAIEANISRNLIRDGWPIPPEQK